MKIAFMTAALISSSLMSVAQAAPAPHKKPTVTQAGTPPDSGAPMTSEEFDKAVKDAQTRGARGTANVDVGLESALSDSFRNLRNEIIGGSKFADGKETGEKFAGITTPAQLHDLLKRLNDDAYYNNLSPDAQYAAAQMAPFIAMRAIFNRAMPLIEPSPFSHLESVTALRAMAAGVMVYLPTKQWEAGIQYMVVPANDMGADIPNENALHNYLEKELIQVIATMAKRLEKLNFAAKPIYFDNKVFYGTADFTNQQDRYVRIGEPERRVALANAYATLSNLESLNAYNLNGFFKAVDSLAKNAGLASVMGFNPDRTTSKKRFAIIRGINQSEGLFNLRPGGNAWMMAAYTSLTKSVANGIIAWKELRARANDSGSMNSESNAYGVAMDPRAVMGADRLLTIAAANLSYTVTGKGKEPLRSAVVSSEGRQISLYNFFSNPPNSLVDLMPNKFDESPYTQTAQINGKNRPYHNYLAGRPVGWPIQEYQKIFPDVKTSADIPFTARVLSQSWGGWVLGIPMSAVLL